MNSEYLFEQIKAKSSYLCVGLDPDIEKLPPHILKEKDPVAAFNKEIINATKDLCVAYKLNIAFFEAMGLAGWKALAKTLKYIPKEHFVIADAKRGDIGNTSKMYARTFFETYEFDAVTVAPYMGEDSVKPFLDFNDKWVILLAITSNVGSKNFQTLLLEDGDYLFERVLDESKTWGSADQMMFVAGATKPELFQNLRRRIPDHFLLVPGVGAQGGDLESISRFGMNDKCGLLVNSSRGIIYASDGKDFAEAARISAQKMQEEMRNFLEEFLYKTA